MITPTMLCRYIATGSCVLRGSLCSHHLIAAHRANDATIVKSVPSVLGGRRNPFRRNLSIITGTTTGSSASDMEPMDSRDGNSSKDGKKDTTNIEIEEVLSFEGKIVPLGPGFTVRRVLPFRKKRSVGPFVFLDHFGPVDLSEHAMNVGPHPHTALMTISFLFEGAILHRDSTGAEQIVLPGEVNAMIAGRGVTHSERGLLEDMKSHLQARQVPPPTGSHGLQVWMALSKLGEDVEPSFHHGKSVPINENTSLVVGESNGLTQSSIPIDPRLGKVFYVDIHFKNDQDVFDLENPGGSDNSDGAEGAIELGVYVSSGKAELVSGWGSLNGNIVEPGHMTTMKVNSNPFKAQIRALESGTRIAILGGSALPEKRHMYWNFVSASKDKVDAAAKAWEQLDRSVFPKVVNESNEDSIPLPGPRK